MLYRLIRPLLFALDPERAHALVFRLLRLAERCAAARPPQPQPGLQQRLWNLDFPAPLGLAAGLDKDGHAPHVWQRLGFGFAEIGTVTAQAQAGNPRPRLFRLPRDRALINRMGFNNDGAVAVAQRLRAAPRRGAFTIPIGVNIGKSRSTPFDDALDDYLISLRALFRYASYVVVNVSSPNTPGLRDLQSEEHLSALVTTLARENAALAEAARGDRRPLLIKVAPDLADSALALIAVRAREWGADGLVATNTTVAREGLQHDGGEAGGLSGAPLRQRATEVIRLLHRADPGLPIVGVGGIFSAADAYEKLRAGASLVQLYTALIYEGPGLPRRLHRELLQLVHRDGFAHVREAIGRDA